MQLDFPVKPKGQLQKENDSKFLQMLKEQRRDGKVTEHGLYEMLQEYMIENDMLRSVRAMTSWAEWRHSGVLVTRSTR